jgi:Chromate resistance exported protein
VRKLRRAFAAIAATDFLGCEAQARLDPKAYQCRAWATRERPWVDRLACAWLIRSQIDARATFVWLQNGKKCPRDAIG